MPLNTLEELTRSNRWREIAESIVLRGQALPASQDSFGTYWIVAGHRIREQVADDCLLSKMLRRTLPPYDGGALILYRGENLERWRAGALGFAWTKEIETARMFGRGLNAVRTGGVLLRGTFAPNAIISGPNRHSRYLQEEQFTVDPFLADSVQLIEQYPPISVASTGASGCPTRS